jgi:hypothetical protein
MLGDIFMINVLIWSKNIFYVLLFLFSSLSFSKEFKESIIDSGSSKGSDYIAMFNISYEDKDHIANHNVNVFLKSAIEESFMTCGDAQLCTSSIMIIPIKNDEVLITYSLNTIKQNGSISVNSKLIFTLNEYTRLYSSQITTKRDDMVLSNTNKQNVSVSLKIIKNNL